MEVINWWKLSTDGSFQLMEVINWWKFSTDGSYQMMEVINLFTEWLADLLIRKVFRPSGKFPDDPKVSKSSGKFPDHSESFQTIRKVSRSSGKFPDHPESFQIIRKVSRPSRNMCILACFLMMDFIGMCKNFPGGNAAMRHGFFCLCISWC